MSIKRKLDEFKPDDRLVDERGPTTDRMSKTDGPEVGDIGTITIRQSPIERGMRRKGPDGRPLFDEKQGMAAVKLYAHWYKSGLGQEVGSADWNRVICDDILYGGMARTETQAFHRQRLRSAFTRIAIVLGADVVRVLQHVVCHETTFRTAGLAIGYESPKKAESAAIAHTKDGLNFLAAEWGL